MSKPTLLTISVVLLTCFVATTVSARPPAHPQPQAIDLHAELHQLQRDLRSLERQVQKLSGDYKTMKRVNAKLNGMDARIEQLLRTTPQNVMPHVVVTLGAPVPPQIVVVQQPAEVGHPAPEPEPEPEPAPTAISEGDFGRIMAAVEGESFADDKLSTLRTAARSRWFSVAQVKRVVEQFSFAKDKLEAVRILKDGIVDPENHFQLYEAFSFSADKKKLRTLLAR